MFSELDPILHSQLRLAIVSMLVSENRLEFKDIQKQTGATAGNISVQLKKLQLAGYIDVNKSFKKNYPLTTCKITRKGISAFELYVQVIQQYIEFK